MTYDKLIFAGAALSMTACVGLLTAAYTPQIFKSRFVNHRQAWIASKCPVGEPLTVRIELDPPRPLAFEAHVALLIDLTKGCRALSISAPGAVSRINRVGVFVPAEGNLTGTGFQREERLDPKSHALNFVGAEQTVEIDETAGAAPITIKVAGAATAVRVSFDTFEVSSSFNLLPGNWRIEMPSTGLVERRGGDMEIVPLIAEGDGIDASYAIDYAATETMAGGDAVERLIKPHHAERTSVRYLASATSLASTSEVFAIVVSTLLGIAISTLVEAVGWSLRR